MEKLAVTVLGTDRPGIVFEVSSLLSSVNCNIEDISQTVLGEEFAGIFLIALPEQLSLDNLDQQLQENLSSKGLYVFVKKIQLQDRKREEVEDESFVVICIGPDKTGLIAAFTWVMTKFEVNISQLRFIHKSLTFSNQSVTIYEVEVPNSIRLSSFVQALKQQAEKEGVEVSVQHKKVFEDICRI